MTRAWNRMRERRSERQESLVDIFMSCVWWLTVEQCWRSEAMDLSQAGVASCPLHQLLTRTRLTQKSVFETLINSWMVHHWLFNNYTKPQTWFLISDGSDFVISWGWWGYDYPEPDHNIIISNNQADAGLIFHILILDDHSFPSQTQRRKCVEVDE